jgi:ATP-dependent Clp protease ATP-binding subunit ClpA
MKVSVSIEIIMQLAAQEAIAAQYKEIEPEHLFEAVLKFSELPAEEVAKIASGSDAIKDLAVEVSTLQEKLAAQSINSTQTRRKLRGQLGNGNSPYDGGQMHRSTASRDLFDTAAKVADENRCETLTVVHLLDAIAVSPTPMIAELLKADGIVAIKPCRHSNTPILDEIGHDLIDLVNKEPPDSVEYGASCKALIQTLAQGHTRGIFLIADNEDVARSIVLSSARIMAGKECPSALKGKRFVDLSRFGSEPTEHTELIATLENAIAEAKAAKNIILYLSPFLEDKKFIKDHWWVNILRSALLEGGIQFVCRATSSSYKHVEKEPTWRKYAHMMRVHEQQSFELPDEV